MALALKADALRAAFARVRARLAAGDDHEAVAERLGLPWADYQELLAKFIEAECTDVRNKTTEQVYVEYVQSQSRNIYDLTKILREYEDSKQVAGLVGAIRARSEIFDKIIDRGQEFGFIAKAPDKAIMGVVMMSDDELRKQVVGELAGLNDLLTRYGKPGDANDPSAVPNIIDVTPGPIHRGTPKTKVLEPLPATAARSKARNTKVHGGRRVVKESA